MILCVASNDDVASKKIAEEIIYGYHFEELEPFKNCQMYRQVINMKEVKLNAVN